MTRNKWRGLCAAGRHGLDFEGQACDLCLPLTRTHRQLAVLINRHEYRLIKALAYRLPASLVRGGTTDAKWPKGTRVIARVAASRSSTDRKISGTRLRHRGKGRRGVQLEIRPAGTQPFGMPAIYVHDTSETYRRHSEARSWVEQHLTRVRSDG